MSHDPIVEEVRGAREQILAEHNYDLGILCKDLQRRTEKAAKNGRRVIKRKPRPSTPK